MARTIWAPGILWFAGARLKVTGKKNLRNLPRPVIVVSNHSSFIDIPVICRSIPIDLYFTAKSQIKRMPFVGLYMIATGMIFIDRSNRQKAIQSIDKASNLIREGKNVLIYPEGRRSINGSVGTFKKGAFHLAIKSDADVVPVAILGAGALWPKSSPTLYPGKIEVRIGKPIPSSQYEEEQVDQFASLTQRNVAQLLQDPS